MSSAARFWSNLGPSYPRTPTVSPRRMPARPRKWHRSGGGNPFGSTAGRFTGGRRRQPSNVRGRYAGFYRKSGFYGRYNRKDGGGELKFHDVDVDQTGANLSAGVILNTSSINLIPQNATESGRIGRKCVIRSIGWRAVCKYTVAAGAGGASAENVRFIMAIDKQCNGAAPLVTDLLESANYQSFNQLANKSRFRVLYDKTMSIFPPSAAGDGAANDFGVAIRPFKFFKKCSIPLEFDNTLTTGAITTIRSNNIFIIMITEGTSSITTLDSKIRLRFSDG